MTPADRSRNSAKRPLAYPLLTPTGKGLIARNGQILQPPRFLSVQRLRLRDAQGRPLDQIRFFAVAEARNGRTRYAVFEESGRKHTDFQFDEIYAQDDVIIGLSPQRALVYDGHTGNQMLDLPYRSVHFSDGMFVATKPLNAREKPMAVYNRNGRRVKFDRNWPANPPLEYHSGLALTFEGPGAFYLDKSGRVAIHGIFGFLGPGNYGDVFPFNDSGFAAGRTRVRTGNRFAIIDRKGGFALPPESMRIRQFIDGRFAVHREKEKLFAIYTQKAGKLTEARYADVMQEDFSFLSAREGEKWHMLDLQGNPIPVPEIDGCTLESAEPAGPTCLQVLYAGRAGHLAGLLSMKGTWLIEPGEYDAVTPFCAFGQRLVYKAVLPGGAKSVLLAADGSSLTQPYDSLEYLSEDVACAILAGQTFLIDLTDRVLWKSKPAPPPEAPAAGEAAAEAEGSA